MKTFERGKTIKELQASCVAAGWSLNTDKYKAGSDFVSFQGIFAGETANVLYSSFNGRFFGQTKNGTWFNSDSGDLDQEPWFDALLNFLYVAKGDPS